MGYQTKQKIMLDEPAIYIKKIGMQDDKYEILVNENYCTGSSSKNSILSCTPNALLLM